jgi:NADPH-dependent 7-cyano-7-deazaguanine reductase QueF-like protein
MSLYFFLLSQHFSVFPVTGLTTVANGLSETSSGIMKSIGHLMKSRSSESVLLPSKVEKKILNSFRDTNVNHQREIPISLQNDLSNT